MATIEERLTKDGEKRYRVLVRLRGYPTQTATFERKTDARRWASSIETKLREGRHFGSQEMKRRTLGDLIDRYIQSEIPKKPRNGAKQAAQLGWWKSKFGDYTLANVTPALIVEGRDKLSAGTVRGGKIRSPGTVNRYLAALSHAFSIASREWGWLENNPCQRVSKLKEPNGRVRYLDDAERKALLTACRGSGSCHLYDIVMLALSTGMRRSEITGLRWKDVDLEHAAIRLEITKNEERRLVPLSGHALTLMTARYKNHTNEIDPQSYVFANRSGNAPIDFRAAWDSAISAAGIEDFRFHDLRHTTASYLAMNHATLSELAAVLGHKSFQMVKRYAHVSDQHTAKVVSDMNAKMLSDVVS